MPSVHSPGLLYAWSRQRILRQVALLGFSGLTEMKTILLKGLSKLSGWNLPELAEPQLIMPENAHIIKGRGRREISDLPPGVPSEQ